MCYIFGFELILPTYDRIQEDEKQRAFVFIEDTDRWVEVYRNKSRLIGKIDKRGEFHVEHTLGVEFSTSGGLPAGILVIPASGPAIDVYEYRSGMLIPGQLKDGYFVPKKGGTIVSFDEYKYGPEAKKIWNLPGHFEEKK
jgi:hypothetical protein